MNQVFLAFRWYFVAQLFGLAVLPLCLRLFRHLPDRGYGLSKPLGLLLAGWAFWLLNIFGWLRNTSGGVLVALALVAIAGIALHQTSQPANRLPWRTILFTEAVFALTFIAGCLVRAHMPRIQTAGGEKWMEIAFLRSILRSDTFPPNDPWLSGFAISYYYFGYVIIAMLTRLAAVPPSIAFNLGVATLFALTCTGAFSLVYNLIRNQVFAASGEAEAPSLTEKPGFSTILVALLGPLLVAVMGNLEGLLESLHARGIGAASFWQWLDIRALDAAPPALADGSWAPTRFFWWWQASRVLQDYTPWGAEQHVIDEFPAFSFILGDMHPHVLALPFVLLVLALALNLYLQTANGERRMANDELRTANGELRMANGVSRFTPHLSLWEFLVYALCLGGLGFLNTWDFPIYLFIVAAAYTLAHLRITHHASRITHHASRFTFLFISLLVSGLFLYLPFWLGFQSQAGGVLVNLFNAARLPQFLVMFGPLVFIAAIFVASQARREGVPARAVLKWTLIAFLSILGALAVLLGLTALLIWLDVIPAHGPAAYVAAWLRGGPIPGLENVPDAHALISRSLLSRLLNPWVALGLIAMLVIIYLIFRQPTGNHSQFAIRKFALLLFATGALLALAVEYVYLRDNFGTRMNTVFKFYFQAWVLWGIAGAYALAGFIRRGGAAAIVALLLVAAGLIYPALAIPARAGEYGGPPTLDGAAYLAQTYPDDYAAIAWLNENVVGDPIILEAPGDKFRAYVYEARVSAHTGLPTLLGWGGHEHQWRGNYDEQALREPDIETLYTSTNPGQVLTLMDKYGISYVYVGPLERARYPAAGLKKFSQLMKIVYDTGSVTIYRYE
ncbi:MAG: DUF2298 domain-containing protein [Chloroflexota bacterium]|nr:DUF2298 domain-containing protein [Chloroflexota bacterium]